MERASYLGIFMEFTYHGMVRYGYGFTNPNHAAALLAILLPLLWYGRINWRKKRPALLLLLSCEFTLYAGLTMTYSRSGVLAVILGGIAFYLGVRYSFGLPLLPARFQRQKRERFLTASAGRCGGTRILLYRLRRGLLFTAIIGLLVLIITSGAGERCISWISRPDRSITNRFAVWRGSLQMLADNPGGVGLGESGNIYTLFYQAPNKRTAYRTMVNSFLTFINEYGIFYWSGLSWLATAIMIAGISLTHNHKVPRHVKLRLVTLLTIIVIILVVGNSSTCFDLSVIKGTNSSDNQELLNSWLQLLLLGLVLAVFCLTATTIWYYRNSLRPIKIIITAFAIVVIINISLIAGGIVLNRARLYRCQVMNSDTGNYVRLLQRTEVRRDVVGLADKSILPTASFVAWLKRHYPAANLTVLPAAINLSGKANDILQHGQKLIVCGQGRLPTDGSLLSKTVLLLPQYPPTDSHLLPNQVILDYYDPYGNNIFWEKIMTNNRVTYLH